jgi:hypothetical protein
MIFRNYSILTAALLLLTAQCGYALYHLTLVVWQ